MTCHHGAPLSSKAVRAAAVQHRPDRPLPTVYNWLGEHAGALDVVHAQNAGRLLEVFCEHAKAVRRHVLFVLATIIVYVSSLHTHARTRQRGTATA